MNEQQRLIANAFRPLKVTLYDHATFFNFWEEVSFNKGDFLTETGKVEHYFYVVLEGVQAIYVLTPTGDKKSDWVLFRWQFFRNLRFIFERNRFSLFSGSSHTVTVASD